MDEMEKQLKDLFGYGENRRITDVAYDKSLAVKCVNGTFVGKKTEDIIAYKGIPFVGKQPVGELRWKAPVDVSPDDGVYEAYYNAKSACQSDFPGEASLFYKGEDCLYLDIWKADDASEKKKPVMVFVHGGAFEAGGTAYPMFECHNFVRENPDVIVVSIAYRLGIFGFLHLSHLPDGEDYPDAQNLGLMDQMMALKWVHENIAGFGGDPDNVTLWGESAGAGSITLLPLVKGSHAYFKRVIAESGSPVFTKSADDGISLTNEVMSILGCQTIADLKTIDGERLVETASIFSMGFSPERDGTYLPLNPYEAYANGAAKEIGFLHGCNLNEFDYFELILEDEYIAWGNERLSKKTVQFTDEERALVESFCADVKGDRSKQISRLFEQMWFNAPLIRLSECQTMAGGKSYNYFFIAKPGHGEEIYAMFDHQELAEETEIILDDIFAKTMRRMWVQFAKTGNPSLEAGESPDGKAKEWPLYDLKEKQVMVLDEFDIHPETVFERKIVDWERTYFLANHYWI